MDSHALDMLHDPAARTPRMEAMEPRLLLCAAPVPELLGVSPELPKIFFNNTGTIVYDCDADLLTVDATPLTLRTEASGPPNLIFGPSDFRIQAEVDKNGQLIGACGETENLDTTSLASLTAGNIAATGGLAKLLGEKEFSILFHEGERDNLHISIIGQRVILVVIFDDRSSLGLVRLRVKKAGEELSAIFNRLMKKAEAEASGAGGLGSPFAEITDEDIDNLFSE